MNTILQLQHIYDKKNLNETFKLEVTITPTILCHLILRVNAS